MSSSRLVLAIATPLLLLSAVAQAGPTHVVGARVFGPPTQSQTIALAPGAAPSESAARALREGLAAAGFRVVSPDAHPQLIASVSYDLRPLCTSACSRTTGHDEAALSGYYTRRALVVARRAEGGSASGAAPVAWFAALQSNGLSDREDDYLPSILRAGATAYGRSIHAEDR